MKNYHELPVLLSKDTKDYIRAHNSLKEEVEALDWYQQRMEAVSDNHLKKVLKQTQ